MVMAAKTVAVGVTAVSMVTLLSGVAFHFRPQFSSNEILDVINGDEAGAVAGRIVSVPVKQYRAAFKATLKLGQCPLIMKNGNIQACHEEFEGDVVLLGRGSATVDVTRVQSSEDIYTHIMGGVGGSVGVLGIASVSSKLTVSVTTETTRKNLNLISSYEMNKGILTLHNAKPKGVLSGSTLFLSEIELGGSEMLLVTLEFESEKKKTEVEVSYTFKILFISISVKLKIVKENFKSSAKVKIQFRSSWRPDITEEYPSLDAGIPRVEEIEKMYMQGPKLLRDMSNDDEKVHNFYYFSSWKESPYGAQLNLALANHDIEFLTEQNTEMQSVIHAIKKAYPQVTDKGKRDSMRSLNTTVTEKSQQLINGLNNYHTLTLDQKKKLRSVYGENKGPQYYHRQLYKLVA